MGFKLCRVGDTGSHGGPITTGSPTCKADGIAIARNGDTYVCAIHGTQTLIASSSVMIDGKMAASVEQTEATCGSVMNTGSSTVTLQN